ncbi:MAG TPA: M2 family metallopeptidase, partial [Longimicrobiaceae bacterium]|nr:M2 family metallopeptidase [Longimicrobiaceae bacterium]
MTAAAAGASRAVEGEVREFVEGHVARQAPLDRECNLALWDAATGGGEEAQERSARARAAQKRLHADPEGFRRIRAWRAGGEVRDPLLRRQLVLLDRDFTANQLAPEVIEDLVRRASELEHLFHTFRSELHGERVSNNQILDVLATERDSAERRAAWEASKQIGPEVAERLRELVRRRNAAARSLGFENAYRMDLHLQELGEGRLFGVLDEFRALTDEPFRRFRAEMDRESSARFGVPVEALRPWHWEDPFAQEAPSSAGRVDLDALFRDHEPVELIAGFFRGIGLPVEEVLARSDLYEREGKDQHAFCLDMDHQGDVRILCNLRRNEKWAGVLLHELGHAVYDFYVPAHLPYLLRSPAHTLSTEAIAMYMGRLTRDPAWLRDVVAAPLDEGEADDIRRQLRASMLIV